MKRTVPLAFCGILTAVSIVLMFFAGLFPVVSFALPAIAGVLAVVVVVEFGVRWAWPMFIATSLLSFLIVSHKSAAVVYIAFFGYYPIVKALIERLHSKIMQYLLKYLLLNVTMIAAYYIMLYVLFIPTESLTFFGINIPLVLLAVGNVTFFFYDYALTAVIATYIKKIHPVFRKTFRGMD